MVIGGQQFTWGRPAFIFGTIAAFGFSYYAILSRAKLRGWGLVDGRPSHDVSKPPEKWTVAQLDDFLDSRDIDHWDCDRRERLAARVRAVGEKEGFRFAGDASAGAAAAEKNGTSSGSECSTALNGAPSGSLAAVSGGSEGFRGLSR